MSWIEQPHPIIALAPMADMTDSPFCRVCREVGREQIPAFAGMTKQTGKDSSPPRAGSNFTNNDIGSFVIFREMVSAEAIVRNSQKTLKMCEFEEIERPLVIQIFGGKPPTIVHAAQIIVEKYRPDGIDINMGCPVPKIAGKSQAGATLMKDHARAVEIVRMLKDAKLGVPISIKTRLGWGKENEILEFAPKLEQAGADLITIHGRTKTQGYSGVANWEMIGKVKKILKIPVIANGDIKSASDAKRCLEITGADGMMIGRGALGNPWLLKNFQTDVVTPDELKKVVLRHARLHLARYGEKSLTTFRKHLLLYFKGEHLKNFGEPKELRTRLAHISTLKELEEILV